MTSTADSAAQFDLADHQREVRSMVRDFAAQRIAPNAADWDRGHVFDRSLYAELAELGLMGVCVPEEYDGAGMDFLSYVLVVEELSRADAGVGVSVRSSVAPASPEHLTAPVVIEPGESALVRVALDENLPGPAAISMAFYSDDPRALGGHPVEARTN